MKGLSVVVKVVNAEKFVEMLYVSGVHVVDRVRHETITAHFS